MPQKEVVHTLEVKYALDKLEKLENSCDASIPEWIMIATRNNEKALCKKQITEDRYLTQQQHINSHVAYFGRECKCERRGRS